MSGSKTCATLGFWGTFTRSPSLVNVATTGMLTDWTNYSFSLRFFQASHACSEAKKIPPLTDS